MKKKVLLTAVLALVGLSENSFAGTVATWQSATGGIITIGTTAGGATVDIKPSANVSMQYKATTATGYEQTGYTIGARHSSGTYTYATSSTDTNIFRAVGIATDIPAAPTTPTGGVTWTNWTASK